MQLEMNENGSWKYQKLIIDLAEDENFTVQRHRTMNKSKRLSRFFTLTL